MSRLAELYGVLVAGADEDPYCTDPRDWYLRGDYKRLKTVIPKVNIRSVCEAAGSNPSLSDSSSENLNSEDFEKTLLSDPKTMFGRHRGYVYATSDVEYAVVAGNMSEYTSETPLMQVKHVNIHTVVFQEPKITSRLTFSEILECNNTRKFARIEQLGVIRITENNKGMYCWLPDRYALYPQKTKSAALALCKRMQDMNSMYSGTCEPKLVCMLGTVLPSETGKSNRNQKYYCVMYRDSGIDINCYSNPEVAHLLTRRIIMQYIFGLYESGRLAKDMYLCYVPNGRYIKHKTYCVCDKPNVSEVKSILSDRRNLESLTDLKEYLLNLNISIDYRERLCEITSLL